MEARGVRLDRVARVLQIVAMTVALFLCFRGNVSHKWCVALFLSVPLARAILFPTFRNSIRRTVADCWRECAEYAQAQSVLPYRAAFFLVALPAMLLLLGSKHFDGGENFPTIMVSGSLVTRGTWKVDDLLETPDFKRTMRDPQGNLHHFWQRRPDGVYSSYPAGLVSFALPVAAAARIAHADLDRFNVHMRLLKFTAAGLTAVSLAFFFLLALHVVDPAPAWVATLFLATGSAMYTTTGQGLWQHGGVIFWSLLILLVEFRHHRQPLHRHAWIQGFACGMMLACRLTAVEVIVPFGLWVLFRSPKRAFLLALVASLTYLPWAALYYSIYGQPLGPSTMQFNPTEWKPLAAIESLWGVLVSPGRGFLIYQPWAILILLACLPLFRAGASAGDRPRSPAGWKLVCLTAVALNFALVSAWGMWWGGHCWGSRLVSDTLPLWGLLCLGPIAWLWARRGGRALLASLVVIGFLINLPSVYMRAGEWNALPDSIDRNPSRLWSWSGSPFLHPFQAKDRQETLSVQRRKP